MQSEADRHDRAAAVGSLHSNGSFAGTDTSAPSGEQTPRLSSTLEATTTAALAQAEEPSDPAPSSSASSVPTLSSTTIEAAAVMQTAAAPPELASGSSAASVTPPHGEKTGGQHRGSSRPPRSLLDKTHAKASAAAVRTRSPRQDRNRDPEEYAASANQQEYTQLHWGGPALDLLSPTPSR
jgi:hypothetical protein